MAEEETPPQAEPEQYELVFKNGALANLKSLAKTFKIPEDDLRLVVSKAISLLSLTKDAKTLTLENKNGERFRVDLEKL